MSAVKCALILWVLSVVKVRSDEIWREGKIVQVAVQSNGTYLVIVGGDTWLRSSASLNALFAQGRWNQLQLEGISKSNGSTAGLGQFTGVSLRFQATGSASGDNGSISLINTFKYYMDTDLFLFETVFPGGATGMAQGAPGASSLDTKVHNSLQELWSSTETSTHFPSFDFSDQSALHTLGYVEWHGRFSSDSNSYGVGLENFKGGSEGGPLVLFNTAGELNRSQSHAIVISSFNNFKHAIASKVTATSSNPAGLAFGIQSYITDVMPGFTLQFGLSGSPYGINAAVESWGEKLRTAYGTTRIAPNFDPTNTKLGYWTDNGAYYYGGYWSKHPQAVAEDILIQVKESLDRMNVPIGYVQLDPWWYPNDNGCVEWIAQPTLFPKGLPWLREQLGIPFLLYANFFSVNNNYAKRKQFDFIESLDYHLSFMSGPIADIMPNQSYTFYDYIMSQHVKSMGAYEVDFLDIDFLPFVQLQQKVDAAEMWMKGMSDAATKYNVSIQLCMELPSDLLQSVKFSSITNARASEDDFPTAGNRWNIAMTAMLMRAVDIGPFFDDIWTQAHQPGNPYNLDSNNIKMRTFISSLSGGPVGISDGVNLTDAELILTSCRSDGILLKPSKPVVPLDAHFMPPNQGGVSAGNIWNTHSQIDSNVWYHVIAFDVTQTFMITTSHLYPLKMTTNQPKFLLGEWGFPGCTNGSLATQCLKPFDDTHPFTVHTPGMNGQEHSFVLYSINPVLSNGWVLLGEASKVVAVSPQRFLAVNVNEDGVTVSVAGKPSESLFVWFVKPSGQIFITRLSVPWSGQYTFTVS